MDSQEVIEQTRLAFRDWVILHVTKSTERCCDVYNFLSCRHEYCMAASDRREEYRRRRIITPQHCVDLGVALKLCDKRGRSHLWWVPDDEWSPCSMVQSFSAKARARAHRGARLRKKG